MRSIDPQFYAGTAVDDTTLPVCDEMYLNTSGDSLKMINLLILRVGHRSSNIT